MQDNNGGGGTNELHENVITFVILAKATNIPREEGDCLMHERQAAPKDSTNWTRLIAQTCESVHNKGHL